MNSEKMRRLHLPNPAVISERTPPPLCRRRRGAGAAHARGTHQPRCAAPQADGRASTHTPAPHPVRLPPDLHPPEHQPRCTAASARSLMDLSISLPLTYLQYQVTGRAGRERLVSKIERWHSCASKPHPPCPQELVPSHPGRACTTHTACAAAARQRQCPVAGGRACLLAVGAGRRAPAPIW